MLERLIPEVGRCELLGQSLESDEDLSLGKDPATESLPLSTSAWNFAYTLRAGFVDLLELIQTELDGVDVDDALRDLPLRRALGAGESEGGEKDGVPAVAGDRDRDRLPGRAGGKMRVPEGSPLMSVPKTAVLAVAS